MLLVADSGSSKTDWEMMLPNGDTLNIQTAGINPIFSTEKDIHRVLSFNHQFVTFASSVKEVYFFGAGCNTPDRRELVCNVLSSKFTNAYIHVDTDLVGAAYATCGHNEGLNCVIGTESNISYFDGQKITDMNSGLGYILDDEASGTHFGKKLITDYLYGNMPTELASLFYKEYKINKEIIIKNIYQKPLPNIYLANYALFMALHCNHPYIKNVLLLGFEAYIVNNILPYPNYKAINTHFVGSIAYNFKEALGVMCNKYEVKVDCILEKPISALYNFIKQREGF
ncbi:MAG: N-acetylglucosamine kinase [Sphingobacteriales bacterium]|nr:MAG: N-acetylglucosamine kinase [Sphingobacteriales bacterium]TAF79459.1 MAG: N-acetylglucosamine kinase [Sphingobacteriales bacterium]